jgi:spermidine synthase
MALCVSLGWGPWAGIPVGAVLFALTWDGGASDRQHVVRADRSFFGVHRVIRQVESDGTEYHRLEHGTTNHGWQCLETGRRCERLGYYHPDTPVGEALAWRQTAFPPAEVAVVGLGAGVNQALSKKGGPFTFYEIDPVVLQIAADPHCFTFLSDCGEVRPRVVLGDGRRMLARARPRQFGLILLDAFSSDSIPTHLLTREAMATYREKMAESGVLVFHISNWFVDLEPLLGRLAADAGMKAIAKESVRTDSTKSSAGPGPVPTRCVVMAVREETLASLAVRPGWRNLEPRFDAPLWEDDFSNILEVLILPH